MVIIKFDTVAGISINYCSFTASNNDLRRSTKALVFSKSRFHLLPGLGLSLTHLVHILVGYNHLLLVVFSAALRSAA